MHNHHRQVQNMFTCITRLLFTFCVMYEYHSSTRFWPRAPGRNQPNARGPSESHNTHTLFAHMRIYVYINVPTPKLTDSALFSLSLRRLRACRCHPSYRALFSLNAELHCITTCRTFVPDSLAFRRRSQNHQRIRRSSAVVRAHEKRPANGGPL